MSGAKEKDSRQGSKNAPRSSKNKTIELSESESKTLEKRLLRVCDLSSAKDIPSGTVNADFKSLAKSLPQGSVDLLILDPPYNLSKDFNGSRFNRQNVEAYTEWLDDILSALRPLLKETASIYICGDWYSSVSIFQAASRHFKVRNRITWEREKGRGALSNWKNSSEDIWFCTVSDAYTFNVEKVKLRRKVIAPYRTADRKPKDWDDTESGAFRDTHPSNMWTDITIPFWSMPENTEHPTQKSEKLLAKLVLASSNPGDLVLDPFLGSGSSSVVAKKLGRRYIGCEKELYYCLLAEKRLEQADSEKRIQGFADGVFWERNTLCEQNKITLNGGDENP